MESGDTMLAPCEFRALLMFNHRFDSQTSASMLRNFLEVVNPPSVKGTADATGAINSWEMKVSKLRGRYSQTLSAELQTAILVGMLPKELQDLVLQRGASDSTIEYDETRDYVLNVALQRSQLRKPGDRDTAVNQATEDGLWDEDVDLGALSRGKECYNCGKT